ncbi:MAG: hypothetical protein GF333_05580 [Candidatus Omnitrophica bacterium]|nr:hypothetical protein [Candidatus Omnitrophota bacterium]
MKNTGGIGKKCMVLGVLFVLSLVYLHQKVLIFVEAYHLSARRRQLNELVDRKDALVYNLSQETHLAKINEWSESHDFKFAERERIVALDIEKQESPEENSFTVASLFRYLPGISSRVPDARAEADAGE